MYEMIRLPVTNLWQLIIIIFFLREMSVNQIQKLTSETFSSLMNLERLWVIFLYYNLALTCRPMNQGGRWVAIKVKVPLVVFEPFELIWF